VFPIPTKAPHPYALRDLYHMKMMHRWPRLCSILTAAVNSELGPERSLEQWAQQPIRAIQAGPLVLEQWIKYRTRAQREFIRFALRNRREFQRSVSQDHEFLIFYAGEWSMLVYQALESFEPVLVDFARHMAELEGKKEETPPIPTGHVN
jgi:hypothetical protein